MNEIVHDIVKKFNQFNNDSSDILKIHKIRLSELVFIQKSDPENFLIFDS